MQFLNTLDGLLDHIKQVESETIELTKESHLRIVQFFQNNGVHADDDVLEAMQYQDIISQQLSATIEAIESVQGYLRHITRILVDDEVSAKTDVERMHEKLDDVLQQAQQKHSAFGGKLRHGENDGIEFF